MFCPNCGHNNKEDALYCVECGTKLEEVKSEESVTVEEPAVPAEETSATESEPAETQPEVTDVTASEETKEEPETKMEEPSVTETPEVKMEHASEEAPKTTPEKEPKKIQASEAMQTVDDTLEKEVKVAGRIFTVQDLVTLISSVVCVVSTVLPLFKIQFYGYMLPFNFNTFNLSIFLGAVIVLSNLVCQDILLHKKENARFVGLAGLINFVAVILVERNVSSTMAQVGDICVKQAAYFLLFISALLILLFGALYTWKWSKKEK